MLHLMRQVGGCGCDDGGPQLVSEGYEGGREDALVVGGPSDAGAHRRRRRISETGRAGDSHFSTTSIAGGPH